MFGTFEVMLHVGAGSLIYREKRLICWDHGLLYGDEVFFVGLY